MKRLILSLLALSLLASGLPQVAHAEGQSAGNVSLASLRSFEVESFYQDFFNNKSAMVEPEVLEYARTRIEKESRLQVASPGDGKLHLYCQGWRCRDIRAVLTQHANGPVLWETQERYAGNKWFPEFKKDHKRTIDAIINRLAEAYQQAAGSAK